MNFFFPIVLLVEESKISLIKNNKRKKCLGGGRSHPAYIFLFFKFSGINGIDRALIYDFMKFRQAHAPEAGSYIVRIYIGFRTGG